MMHPCVDFRSVCVQFANNSTSINRRSPPWSGKTHDEDDDTLLSAQKRQRLVHAYGGEEEDLKPAAKTQPVDDRKPPAKKRDVIDNSDEEEDMSARKKKKKKKNRDASGDKSWKDPRQGGAARGGDSAVLERDEDSINATLAYSELASNLYLRKSDNFEQHSFGSFHKVPGRNEDQRAATKAAKKTSLRAVDYLAEMNEVVDPRSPIFPYVNGDSDMFTADNGRTNGYHIEDRSADAKYHGKFGVGGKGRADKYKDELGVETFKQDITMTSLVDLDNIVADTQRGFTEMVLDGLRPLGCTTIPETVFDLVECARMGLPPALQLAILLLDTPSTQCDDLGGLMEINAWLKEFAKVVIETGLTERARRRDPTDVNFRQPDEWIRCNEVGFGVAGQQLAYSGINLLLTLLPPRVRETLLKGENTVRWVANWNPGVVKTEATKDRTEGSRGTKNIYAKFCKNVSDFMDAQETPPTGNKKPSSADIKKCYDTSLYTRTQNRESCDKRDGVLHFHAKHGGGLLVVERCPTSMTQRGGVDMVLHIMSLRPFKDEFENDESRGVEPRWIPVMDKETGKPLEVLGRIVFLYMDVGWDEELRIVAVINNPSDIIDSNTDRPAHTWGDVSGMCMTARMLDGLKYAGTLVETEDAEIVENVDIQTMPFRESFCAMFGMIVYYKKFLNLPAKSSSLFFQNLMQAPGYNIHWLWCNGLRRNDEFDLFGDQARAEKRLSEQTTSGVKRDSKVHRSIVAAGSKGNNIDECVEKMIEAALQNRKNGSAEITDPKDKSKRLSEFVNKAREDGFIEEELIGLFEDKCKSKAANSGNTSSHNHTGYDTLPTRNEELTQLVQNGGKFLAQATGKAQ